MLFNIAFSDFITLSILFNELTSIIVIPVKKVPSILFITLIKLLPSLIQNPFWLTDILESPIALDLLASE